MRKYREFRPGEQELADNIEKMIRDRDMIIINEQSMLMLKLDKIPYIEKGYTNIREEVTIHDLLLALIIEAEYNERREQYKEALRLRRLVEQIYDELDDMYDGVVKIGRIGVDMGYYFHIMIEVDELLIEKGANYAQAKFEREISAAAERRNLGELRKFVHKYCFLCKIKSDDYGFERAKLIRKATDLLVNAAWRERDNWEGIVERYEQKIEKNIKSYLMAGRPFDNVAEHLATVCEAYKLLGDEVKVRELAVSIQVAQDLEVAYRDSKDPLGDVRENYLSELAVCRENGDTDTARSVEERMRMLDLFASYCGKVLTKKLEE